MREAFLRFRKLFFHFNFTLPNIVSNKIGTGLQLENRKASLLCGFCAVKPLFGRSDRVRTCGLNIPNVARYQLRHTPIVIKLWSCKWSNLWSNTFLTAFFHFPNRPKSARLKGFRRFSLSCGVKTAYAPKCRALPTALYPDSLFNCGRVSGQICGQTHF